MTLTEWTNLPRLQFPIRKLHELFDRVNTVLDHRLQVRKVHVGAHLPKHVHTFLTLSNVAMPSIIGPTMFFKMISRSESSSPSSISSMSKKRSCVTNFFLDAPSNAPFFSDDERRMSSARMPGMSSLVRPSDKYTLRMRSTASVIFFASAPVWENRSRISSSFIYILTRYYKWTARSWSSVSASACTSCSTVCVGSTPWRIYPICT
ncbi:hypothetical protein DSLPV1_036 [Dishui lake phycodnavirus 1]|uniref:hypothetical protein n=1 Tax=Dishui lake phycodnavirus 1 TaxID=2079134 RepID=UPI000CD6A779|nr:hypothetical protein C5Y57_gp036 [Dishui lake phycodnavirus 1]AUT19007.1 hypothetical protein DSLPV1_036 [Dishui lake phycodnavirus 1]